MDELDERLKELSDPFYGFAKSVMKIIGEDRDKLKFYQSASNEWVWFFQEYSIRVDALIQELDAPDSNS